MLQNNPIIESLPAQWRELLSAEFGKEYFAELMEFVKGERSEHTVYPPEAMVFSAFSACLPSDVKVVIIGQDPYHGEGQANGLAFSVGYGIKLPPSLRNILREVITDVGESVITSGDLTPWAEQGVLLINTSLTVRRGEAASHSGRGWERFTDSVIEALARHRSGVVYMLWGSHAQRKGAIIDKASNCVLESVHPSPLSAYRGFFGSKHFSAANEYLESVGSKKINW
ncbi:MAG: uracil-DNA glycosylase [Rikenellaceae bacterium]